MATLTTPRTVADVIREGREKRGWSQVELSYEARVPQTTISKIETGRHVPTLQVFHALCAALGVNPNVLDLTWDKRRYLGYHLSRAS